MEKENALHIFPALDRNAIMQKMASLTPYFYTLLNVGMDLNMCSITTVIKHDSVVLIFQVINVKISSLYSLMLNMLW